MTLTAKSRRMIKNFAKIRRRALFKGVTEIQIISKGNITLSLGTDQLSAVEKYTLR